MFDEIFRSIGWVGVAIGILAVILVLEVLFRTLYNTYGTPQDRRYPHRVGTELPRELPRK
jgi:hypothetical protein